MKPNGQRGRSIGNYNGRISIISTTNIHVCTACNKVARWYFVTRVMAHRNWPRAPDIRCYSFPLARGIFLTRVNIECAQYSLPILQPVPECLCNSYLQMTRIFGKTPKIRCNREQCARTDIYVGTILCFCRNEYQQKELQIDLQIINY